MFVNGDSIEKLLAAFSTITREDVLACLDYVATLVEEQMTRSTTPFSSNENSRDENIPKISIAELRSKGHEVLDTVQPCRGGIFIRNNPKIKKPRRSDIVPPRRDFGLFWFASYIEVTRRDSLLFALSTNGWDAVGVFTQARSIIIEGRTPGTIYEVQARAVGGLTGYSDWSDPFSHMAM